ncbi:MAG TPA: beta/gamma crystallin-related protein, partial [Gemmatimonadota bacterium]|nr:beta/gamma crystallin-related protein [Gemmatimonadota bacterium]
MPTRTALHAFLAFALLPAGLEAASITVWEHDNFKGTSLVFNTAVSRLDAAGWNDRISSFRVDSGQWEVCRDSEFRNCQIFGPSQGLARLDSGWNDAISSLRPVGGAATAHNPEVFAERLYRALLGRDSDPEGLRNAANQIRAGKLSDLVSSMTQSQEFRNLSQQRRASEILDQIYRGLLDRRADEGARTAYLTRIERGQVADVVLDILASSGGGAVAAHRDQTTMGQGVEVQAKGSGVVIWGGKKYFDTVTGAKVQLGRDGRIQI